MHFSCAFFVLLVRKKVRFDQSHNALPSIWRYASATIEYPIICSFVFSIFNCYYRPISAYHFCIRRSSERKTHNSLESLHAVWMNQIGTTTKIRISLLNATANHKLAFIHSFTVSRFVLIPFSHVLFGCAHARSFSLSTFRLHAFISLEHCFHY